MSTEEEKEIVRRLQARADAMRDKPLDILLGSQPGPYQLPLCTYAGVHILDSNKAQLILDTESGQRILLPVSIDVLRTLENLIPLP